MLWLAAALSAIAFSVANTVRTETERTGTASEGLRTYYLASGSIERAILWLQWSNNGLPNYYRPPTPFLRFDYPSGQAVVEIIPESTKVNINLAPPEELQMLLVASGANPAAAGQITANIIDWRSPGPPPVDFQFLNPDQTFRPRHASFQEIEDVLQVRGVTPELFYGRFDRDAEGRLIPLGGLRDTITTHGSQANLIDANSAPPVLLAGIGIPPQAVDAIVRRRRAKPFQSIVEIIEIIGNGPWLRRLQVATEAGQNRLWTLRATARIRLANGRLSDLSRTVSATIVFPQQISQQEPNYFVLRWRDEAATIGGPALPFIELAPDANNSIRVN